MVSDLSRDVLQGFRRDSRLYRDAVATLYTQRDMDELVRFAKWNSQRYGQHLLGLGFSAADVNISAAYIALAMRLTMGSHQWSKTFEVMVSSDLFSTREDVVTAVDILYDKMQDSKAAVRSKREESSQRRLPVQQPKTVLYNGEEYVRHFCHGQVFGAEHVLVEVGMMVELGRIWSLDDLRDVSFSGAQYTSKNYWSGLAETA